MNATLSTLKKFCTSHDAFTIGGERYKVFNEHQNGMAEMRVVVRDGSKVLYHEERYFLWLELKNTGELDAVRKLLRQAKKEGAYLTPEEAVARVRGRSDAA